ncbi:MAG: HEAT repeat domain-containing protein, partial [Bradymonadaceae bacterium]
HWVLITVVCIGLILIGIQAVALVIQASFQRIKARRTEDYRRRIEDYLKTDDRRLFIKKGKRQKNAPVLRDVLFHRILKSEGSDRRKLVELYEELDFVKADYDQLKDEDWRVRLQAMRRLFVMPAFEPWEALYEGLEDHPRIRLLCAHVLARIGSAADTLRALNALELPSNLMEQPVYALLRRLDDERLAILLAHLDAITRPRVQRAVVVMASARGLRDSMKSIDQLSRSEDIEVRIGVCVAAGQMQGPRPLSLLLELLRDRAWEVRAQAAKALCHHSDPQVLMPLALAMNDPAFWVRQNAAMAMEAVTPESALLAGRDQPTLDELCFFDDYIESNVVWVAGASAPTIQAEGTQPQPAGTSS